MSGLINAAILIGYVAFSAADSRKEVRYGKYFSIPDGGPEYARDYSDNTYYLYSPPRNLALKVPALLPVVIHLYGCGWKNCLSPWQRAGPIAGKLLLNGISVVSVGYRRITTSYWYESNASLGRSPEELVHVNADGKLYLDTKNLTFSDYKFRVSRHEALVKPTYDVVMAMEHMIRNAFDFGLDMNRLVFWCYSAGGTMAQYMTYVYHKWNTGRYTPLGMFYRSPMLDIPTANILDRVWDLIAAATKKRGKTRLKDLMDKKDCSWEIGNGCHDPIVDKWYQKSFPYTACNATWNQVALAKYCGDHFDNATVQELIESQRWPRDDPEVGVGMEKIWYASKNMMAYAPKPFYVHLYNLHKEDYALLHSSLYVSSFKYFMSQSGIEYSAYYDDLAVMQDYGDPNSKPPQDVVLGDNHKLKYSSTFGWREMMHGAGLEAKGDNDEAMHFVCFALSQPQCSPQFAAAQRRVLQDIHA